MAPDGLLPNDTFGPFSNGTEYHMWLDRNCRRGHGCRNYNPEASTSRDGCPMEVAICLAAVTDGQIKAKHGLRCGICEPGANGMIVEAPGDCTTWRCPEYRGRDEPDDDQPRRGPRPSSGQLDLLDPRNEPSRDPVRA
jgi:hypothetical protein